MATDAIVTAADVLRAMMELRRRGHDAVLRELEQQEPDLAEHLMEELGGIHRQLLETGATPKRVRRLARRVEAMALVLVGSLRHAHRRLWQEEAQGTRLTQLDPSMAKNPPHPDLPTVPPTEPTGPEDDNDHDERRSG